MTSDPLKITIPMSAPRAGSRVFAWFGRQGLKMLGWEIHGGFPDQGKLLVVVAPHRSNWDWIVGVCALWALQLKFSYLIKDTVMIWPLSALIRNTGGIPIDRSSPDGVIEQVTEAFKRREKLYFAITPEGTRKEVKRWKSGFLRIAYAANLPVVPAYIDYPRKRISISEPFGLNGDLDEDLGIVQGFFREQEGSSL